MSGIGPEKLALARSGELGSKQRDAGHCLPKAKQLGELSTQKQTRGRLFILFHVEPWAGQNLLKNNILYQRGMPRS